jgi:hypothetical protein
MSENAPAKKKSCESHKNPINTCRITCTPHHLLANSPQNSTTTTTTNITPPFLHERLERRISSRMVLYYTSNVVEPSGFIYVGKDKYESESHSFSS